MSRTSRLLAVAALCATAAATLVVPASASPWGATRSCAKPAPQAEGTSVLHEISSGGRERTYQLHLPEGYSGKTDWPLVLAYHGRGNTGAGTEEFSKLSTLPAVVAYPNGVVGTGEGERQAWQGAPYSAPGVDDVAFTRDLLDKLQAQLCTDAGRVYATGKSNGAGFTAILACRLASRITAIAPVAGAFYGTGEPPCRPSRPVPVIEFHGSADVTVPYTGDEERGLPGIRDWVSAWAKRDGCRTTRPDTQTGTDITTSTWTGCKDDVQVKHVRVTEGGHTWPGADVYSGGGVTTQTIEAHEVLWRFVRDYRLPC
ncbi:polyhydroxybutyrate depolymerase [Crossiella equi]|uniref:Polyhydroxybutyrate depolymerase n=1 Tax=Crossiella equi TaxID=130796 RepID=A0ABS5A7R2_9PSEU|nr:PHB depolymerase family esterase [Crossiella equi]MBP2472610.1 polyhydroxybutyrate depolymerase [Crossiella equi]